MLFVKRSAIFLLLVGVYCLINAPVAYGQHDHASGSEVFLHSLFRLQNDYQSADEVNLKMLAQQCDFSRIEDLLGVCASLQSYKIRRPLLRDQYIPALYEMAKRLATASDAYTLLSKGRTTLLDYFDSVFQETHPRNYAGLYSNLMGIDMSLLNSISLQEAGVEVTNPEMRGVLHSLEYLLCQSEDISTNLFPYPDGLLDRMEVALSVSYASRDTVYRPWAILQRVLFLINAGQNDLILEHLEDIIHVCSFISPSLVGMSFFPLMMLMRNTKQESYMLGLLQKYGILSDSDLFTGYSMLLNLDFSYQQKMNEFMAYRESLRSKGCAFADYLPDQCPEALRNTPEFEEYNQRFRENVFRDISLLYSVRQNYSQFRQLLSYIASQYVSSEVDPLTAYSVIGRLLFYYYWEDPDDLDIMIPMNQMLSLNVDRRVSVHPSYLDNMIGVFLNAGDEGALYAIQGTLLPDSADYYQEKHDDFAQVYLTMLSHWFVLMEDESTEQERKDAVQKICALRQEMDQLSASEDKTFLFGRIGRILVDNDFIEEAKPFAAYIEEADPISYSEIMYSISLKTRKYKEALKYAGTGDWRYRPLDDLLCGIGLGDKKMESKSIDQGIQRIREGFLSLVLMASSQREARYYSESAFIELSLMACIREYALQHRIEEGYAVMAPMLYDYALASKGTLLRSNTIVDNYFRNSSDQMIREAWIQSKALKTEAKDLLAKDKTVVESNLMSKLRGDRRRLIQYIPQWENVRNQLAEDDAAIEYLCLEDDHQHQIMLAMVLRKQFDSPVVLPLGESPFSALDITSASTYEDRTTMKELCSYIWTPLEPYLQDVRNIYYSLDGVYSFLNLELLADSSESRLNDRYNMYRVSSTGQKPFSFTVSSSSDIVLFGGLDYNLNATPTADPSNTKGASMDYVLPRGDIREQTHDEVGFIQNTMKQAGCRTSLYEDVSGTRDKFLSLDGEKHDILHVSTHGFYWDLDKYEGKTVQPMWRSGLVFTSEPIDDIRAAESGAVYSYEIADTDFSNVSFVVLSACQTGYGESGNDGVFGVYRGFKQAGVSSIMMTLWSVDVDTTTRLMKSFYVHLAEGNDARSSLRMAQESIKTSVDNNDWAAFVILD